MKNLCLFGDVRDGLRQMADAGVKAQMCVTSPPYFGLRSYLPEDHPDKPKEIGTEKTPDDYIAKLVDVFRCVRDVLADDGTLWVNIGDSYASGDRGWRAPNTNGMRSAANAARINDRPKDPTGIKPKDLIGIPWMLAFALRADGWYLRQEIVWHKNNPMPESVTDRCTKSHEHLFLLAKRQRYYFDADAIKEPAVAGFRGSSFTMGKTNVHQMGRASRKPRRQDSTNTSFTPGGSPHGGIHRAGTDREPETRNRRSVWTIATRPYSGAHFAVFPPDLVEPCILAGSRPGDIVLDPFMGSGTTAMVAERLGRHWLGCDLDSRCADLQAKRLCQRVLPL